MRFVSPLDTKVLHEVFSQFRHIITVEDGVLKGGFGSAVIEFMSDNGYNSEVRRLGIPDYFVEQGTQEELYAECGFDADGIEIAVREMLVRKGTGQRAKGSGTRRCETQCNLSETQCQFLSSLRSLCKNIVSPPERIHSGRLCG